MNKRLSNIIIGIIAFVFILLLIDFFIKKQHLKADNKIAEGTITSVKRQSKTGTAIEYTFEVNLKKYKNAVPFPQLNYNDAYAFLGKHFPVIYFPSNPDNSLMLINPDDWLDYNLKLPDSLNWVKRFF